MELIHIHLMLCNSFILMECMLKKWMQWLHLLIKRHSLMIEMAIKLLVLLTSRSWNTSVVHPLHWLKEPILIIQLLRLLANIIQIHVLIVDLSAFQTFWIFTFAGRWLLTPRFIFWASILIGCINKFWINNLFIWS